MTLSSKTLFYVNDQGEVTEEEFVPKFSDVKVLIFYNYDEKMCNLDLKYTQPNSEYKMVTLVEKDSNFSKTIEYKDLLMNIYDIGFKGLTLLSIKFDPNQDNEKTTQSTQSQHKKGKTSNHPCQRFVNYLQTDFVSFRKAVETDPDLSFLKNILKGQQMKFYFYEYPFEHINLKQLLALMKTLPNNFSDQIREISEKYKTGLIETSIDTFQTLSNIEELEKWDTILTNFCKKVAEKEGIVFFIFFGVSIYILNLQTFINF